MEAGSEAKGINLDQLTLAEKHRVLSEMQIRLQEAGCTDAALYAQQLQDKIIIPKSPIKEKEEERHTLLTLSIEKLHAQLLLDSKNESTKAAALQSLMEVAEYWSGNGGDGLDEALDPITYTRISCPLLATPKAPKHLDARAREELITAFINVGEAYCYTENQFYYLSLDARVEGEARTLHILKLKIKNPEEHKHLKAILGIVSEPEFKEESCIKLEEELRQIQMLSIKRYSGHDPCHRILLPSHRRVRLVDGFLQCLKKDGADTELRGAVFSKEDYAHFEAAALARHKARRWTKPYQPLFVESINPASTNKHVARVPTYAFQNSYWPEVLTVGGFTVYLLSIFTAYLLTGPTALTVLALGFVAGLLMMASGLTFLSAREVMLEDERLLLFEFDPEYQGLGPQVGLDASLRRGLSNNALISVGFASHEELLLEGEEEEVEALVLGSGSELAIDNAPPSQDVDLSRRRSIPL